MRTVTALSEASFEAEVQPVLRASCASSCHQAVGSDVNTPAGTSFRQNRFVLTGSTEGDYGATLSMISDTCNPASNLLLKRAVDGAAPGRCGDADDGRAARGQRRLHRHRGLDPERLPDSMTRRARRSSDQPLVATLAALAGCGGGDNPLDNPTSVQNPPGTGGRTLSFVYFQKCINPILLTTITSSSGTSSCASAGCHDNVTGTGGALRVVPERAPRWTWRTRPTPPTRCARATCTRTSTRRRASPWSASRRRAGC